MVDVVVDVVVVIDVVVVVVFVVDVVVDVVFVVDDVDVVVVLLLLFCCCCFAVVVLLLLFCCCCFVVVVLLLLFCCYKDNSGIAPLLSEEPHFLFLSPLFVPVPTISPSCAHTSSTTSPTGPISAVLKNHKGSDTAHVKVGFLFTVYHSQSV